MRWVTIIFMSVTIVLLLAGVILEFTYNQYNGFTAHMVTDGYVDNTITVKGDYNEH